MDFTVGQMKDDDWEAVGAVYQDGIATGNATMVTKAPERNEWDGNHLGHCRLVAKSEGEVVGWAALSPVLSECAYSGVAGVSVYVAASARGREIGKALLFALAEESESAGIWTLQARIFPENVASVALHESCGFRVVGVRERIGKLNDVWRDVVLMERRSKVVGV